MALIKSINENYKDLTNDQFYKPEEHQELKTKLMSFQDDWLELGLSLRIKDLPFGLRDTPEEYRDDLIQYLIEEWKNLDSEEERISIILLRTDNLDWTGVHKEIFNQMIRCHEAQKTKFNTWLHLFRTTGELINPVKSEQVSLIDRILRRPMARAKRQYHKMESHTVFLSYLFGNSLEQSTEEQLLAQGRIKDEHYREWQSRLQKAGLWEEDEEILEVGGGRLIRNHFSVNSNFNRSGKFVLTNRKLIFARRSFSFFSLGLAALLPIIAFVRPANKLILFGRTIYQYLKIPVSVAKPVIRGMWPAIAAVVVSINFIDFDSLRLSLENFFDQIPTLNFITPSIGFAFEHPEIIPAFGGMFALFRLGFLKVFFRRQKLIYLPLDQLNFALVDGRELVGRWQVKGYQLLGAKEGIQYRIRFRSYRKEIDNQTLAMRMYAKIMNAALRETKKQYTSSDADQAVQ